MEAETLLGVILSSFEYDSTLQKLLATAEHDGMISGVFT